MAKPKVVWPPEALTKTNFVFFVWFVNFVRNVIRGLDSALRS